jgi:polar amino acid transport system substrate-binding protein
MRQRSLLVLPLLTVAALLLGACGDDEASEETTTTAAEGGTTDSAISLEGVTLVEDGQLTVCSDMPYEPFEFQNEDGETEGFDYDVVSAMGEQLGVEVEFVTTPFDGIIAALQAGNCDMIASAMTITDERAEQVNFTEPYFDADQSLLVLKENEEKFATLEDLTDSSIGVQSGTTGATYAAENQPEGSEIKEFATGAEMFPALVSGDIDAALQDLPVNAYRATTAPDEFVVTETFTTGEQYGFAVAKENTALLTALDAALAASKEDGTYDAAYATWFGEPKN